MSQRKKGTRNGARAQSQKKRRPMGWFVAAPLAVAAIVLVITMTSKPAYSDFDIIGKRPAVVQVYLPG